jgi:hypothetical protein
MISRHNRCESAFCLVMALLSLASVSSCTTTAPDQKPDLRAELTRSLKGANVDGYVFATREDDSQVLASLTNSAVRNLITIDEGTTNTVLRYTSVTDKKTNTTKTYKAEAVKTGTSLAIVVTDIVTGDVLSRDTFPVPAPHGSGEPTFDSLEACIKDFDCKNRGALQCEANRTCKDQFAALTCCLTNGQCFSVHLIIRPTTLRCTLLDVIPNLEGLVLKQ